MLNEPYAELKAQIDREREHVADLKSRLKHASAREYLERMVEYRLDNADETLHLYCQATSDSGRRDFLDCARRELELVVVECKKLDEQRVQRGDDMMFVGD